MKNLLRYLAFAIMLATLVLTVGCKDNSEKKAIDLARHAAYESCRDKWNKNDTSRQSLLLMVQLQFAKKDQLSAAPNTPTEAIRFWCNIYSDEAANVEKQNRISGKDGRFDE